MPDNNNNLPASTDPNRPVLTTEEVPTASPPSQSQTVTPTNIPDPNVQPDTPPLSTPESVDVPPPPTDIVGAGLQPTSNDGSSAPSFNLPPIVGAPPRKKFGGKKVISTILGLLLLVGGIGAGVTLVRQQQDIREKAMRITEGGSTGPTIKNTGTGIGTGTTGGVGVGVGTGAKSAPKDSDDEEESVGTGTTGGVGVGVGTGTSSGSSSNCAFVGGACDGKGKGSACGSGGTCKESGISTSGIPSCACEEPKQAVGSGATTGAKVGAGVDTTTNTTGCTDAQKAVCANRGELCSAPSGICLPKSVSSSPTCYQNCISAGNTPSECNALPQCFASGKSPTCYDECLDAGNTPIECSGYPACSTGGTGGGSQATSSSGSCRKVCIKTDCDKVPAGCSNPINNQCNTDADCGGGGSTTTTTTTTTTTSAQCLNIKAYDTGFNQLTTDELKDLRAGDTVRFAVAGSATSGSFDKARFKINSGSFVESTTKKPNSQEFYYEYTIPAGTTSFNITAQIHHATLGWSN